MQRDDDKPKRVSIPKLVNPKDINLEKALLLLSLPRVIGNHPETNKEITANIGRYGPYLKYDINSVSLPNDETLKEMAGKDFSKFKENLSEVLIDTICPIGKKIEDLNKDKGYLMKVLKDGSNRARLISEKNLNKIKEIVGFI